LALNWGVLFWIPLFPFWARGVAHGPPWYIINPLNNT
jgi:hypothetical protein